MSGLRRLQYDFVREMRERLSFLRKAALNFGAAILGTRAAERYAGRKL